MSQRPGKRKLRYACGAVFFALPLLAIALLLAFHKYLPDWFALATLIVAIIPILVLETLNLYTALSFNLNVPLTLLTYFMPPLSLLAAYIRSGRSNGRWGRLQRIRGKPLF